MEEIKILSSRMSKYEKERERTSEARTFEDRFCRTSTSEARPFENRSSSKERSYSACTSSRQDSLVLGQVSLVTPKYRHWSGNQ